MQLAEDGVVQRVVVVAGVRVQHQHRRA
jgi:hypothetical protein